MVDVALKHWVLSPDEQNRLKAMKSGAEAGNQSWVPVIDMVQKVALEHDLLSSSMDRRAQQFCEPGLSREFRPDADLEEKAVLQSLPSGASEGPGEEEGDE